jgi:hypothetical protein
VYNIGGNEKGGVGGKKGYINSSSGNSLVELMSIVGYRIQNGTAFIMQNHMLPRERQASRSDLVLPDRTVYDAGR